MPQHRTVCHNAERASLSGGLPGRTSSGRADAQFGGQAARVWGDRLRPVPPDLVSTRLSAATREFLTTVGLPAGRTRDIVFAHDERLHTPIRQDGREYVVIGDSDEPGYRFGVEVDTDRVYYLDDLPQYNRLINSDAALFVLFVGLFQKEVVELPEGGSLDDAVAKVWGELKARDPEATNDGNLWGCSSMTSQPNSTVPKSTIAGRKLLALLAALVALLAMAPVTGPAHAQPPLGYDLVPAGPGDPLQVPVLIYRHRHTILTPSGEDSVSWARNVAGFEWVEQQVTWIAVAAHVSGWPNNSSIVHVDLFQRDQTGALRLVDTAGNALLEPGGTPVDWRASPTSTLRWNLSTESDPEVRADYRGGRMHSERVAYWFLKKHRPAAVDQVERGFSEKIPCNTLPSRCQQNLKSKWFSGLTVAKSKPTWKARPS